MIPSRRTVLAAGPAAMLLQSTGAHADTFSDVAEQIRSRFHALPGDKNLKIWAPATPDSRELLVEIHPHKKVFVASAFKTFVLCARLKALDSPNIVDHLKSNDLDLDESIWSIGSDVFNPPELAGKVSERTAAEAMITHSDNTGTDMLIKVTGADYIREFIAGLGLSETQIPDSTRVFVAYVLGLSNYKSAGWSEILAYLLRGAPLVKPLLNEVQTLASSASDLVSLYAQTLREGFFENDETLREYRRILSLSDGAHESVPLGTSGFAKTGYADFPGRHVRSNAGAMLFNGRWVYFATIINWYSAGGSDPETVAAWTNALQASLQLIYDSQS